MAEVGIRGPWREPVEPGAIRVCHIASGDLWAGAEVQVATLLKYLARDSRVAVSAILLNSGRLADEIARLGVESAVIPESENGFWEILRAAMRFLRGKNIQVFHSHRYKENLLAALLAWRLDVPVLIRTRHGMVEPLKGLKEVKQTLIQGVDRLTARWTVDRVISVSREMAGRLGRDLGPEKVITIPNGIDFGQARSDLTPAEARERLRIPAGCRVIGAAGRLEPVKRLDIFLEAALQISREVPTARFVIAGEGREQARLQALARKLGLPDRVRFLGHRDDIFDVLRAMDILVVSSDHEGLPMVLLEALAMGLTVVGRNVGGIPEVVENGVTGILVQSNSPAELASACLEVLSDEEHRCRLGGAARNFVREHFSAESGERHVVELYQSLIRSV